MQQTDLFTGSRIPEFFSHAGWNWIWFSLPAGLAAFFLAADIPYGYLFFGCIFFTGGTAQWHVQPTNHGAEKNMEIYNQHFHFDAANFVKKCVTYDYTRWFFMQLGNVLIFANLNFAPLWARGVPYIYGPCMGGRANEMLNSPAFSRRFEVTCNIWQKNEFLTTWFAIPDGMLQAVNSGSE